MLLFWLQISMLAVGITFLLVQLGVRHKQTFPILFAIFCGSIAIFASRRLRSEQLGMFEYLVAMGACATCNVYWLIARALFRGEQGINKSHIGVAASVSVLLILAHGLAMLQDIYPSTLSFTEAAKGAIFELIGLLSSGLMVLTAWEGWRGLPQSSGAERKQRILFLASFATALLLNTVADGLFAGTPYVQQANYMLAAIFSVQVMLVTQYLIYWRGKTAVEKVSVSPEVLPIEHDGDRQLAEKLEAHLQRKEVYLQANLKVADVAQVLGVSEYRITRTLRNHFDAANFNQLVNARRVDYAQSLLRNKAVQHWPILVIAMESGFASVGPFTRAFKQHTNLTPGQYRQRHLAQPELNSESLLS